MVHLLTIKLSSSNYLLWRSQVLPLLKILISLFGYFNDYVTMSSATDASGFENPEPVEWQQMDQLVLSLILSSLTEEAMSIVVGLPFSHAVWSMLETTFSHLSKSCELRIKDDLQHMKKNSCSVVEFF